MIHPIARTPEEWTQALAPRGERAFVAKQVFGWIHKRGVSSFDRMTDNWFSLTYMLNNLNRGIGLPDGYPFVLSTPAIDKLRFVHETVGAAAG